jgi:hypothetical protein
MQFSRALIIGRPGGGASRGIVDCRNTDSRAAGYLAPAGTTVAVCSVQGHPKVSPAEAEADDRKDIVVLNIVPYGPGLSLVGPEPPCKTSPALPLSAVPEISDRGLPGFSQPRVIRS